MPTISLTILVVTVFQFNNSCKLSIGAWLSKEQMITPQNRLAKNVDTTKYNRDAEKHSLSFVLRVIMRLHAESGRLLSACRNLYRFID
jgi:hypothetical protein